MKSAVWRPLLTVVLLGSLGANAWLGRNAVRSALEIREGAAYLTWGTSYALNGVATMLADPNWNSPAFRASVLEMLEWATLYAQSAGSTMGGLTAGPYHRVVTALNQLSFSLSGYRSIAMRAASADGPVAAEDQTVLQAFAAHLREAGWPRDPVHRDRPAEWNTLAEALERLLALENNETAE